MCKLTAATADAPATIRHARQDDFKAWFDLFKKVLAERIWMGREGPLDVKTERELFKSTIEKPATDIFLADAESELVGFLVVSESDGRVGIGMAVEPNHRRQGIGTLLVETCLRWAQERSAHKVYCDVWPHNTAAIALYRSHGFLVEGRLVREYRRQNGELWDALRMALVLDAESLGSLHRDAIDMTS